VIERFLSGMPTRFQVANGPVVVNAVIASIDPETGAAQAITRVTDCFEVEQ